MLLTINETAATLHTSRKWVERQIEIGRLPIIELGAGQGRGRMVRVWPQDIAQLVNDAPVKTP